MRFLSVPLAFLIAACPFAAAPLPAKDPVPIRPRPANTYAAFESQGGVSIAVEPYETAEKSKAAFGKYDPLKAGILPVYVVISNTTADAIRMDRLKIELVTASRSSTAPVSGNDVSLRMKGKKVKTPRISNIPRISRYDPDAITAIVNPEFLVRMAPPGDTIGGFLYFDTGDVSNPLPGGHLYVSGLTWARSGQELLYFEIPFDKYLKK